MKGGLHNPITNFADLLDTKVIRKSADETVNNSTTLQDDDELLFPIAANEVWYFEFFLLIQSSADMEVADWKWAISALPP